jgi:hypothetical protein
METAQAKRETETMALADKIKADVAMMLANEGRDDAWFAEYDISPADRDAARAKVSARQLKGV